MSDTDNKQKQPEAVDWGLRLREFMEKQAQTDKHDASPEDESKGTRDKGQDELDAMLIEQLQRTSARPSAPKSVPPEEAPQDTVTPEVAEDDEPYEEAAIVEDEETVGNEEPVTVGETVEDEEPVTVEETIEDKEPVVPEEPVSQPVVSLPLRSAQDAPLKPGDTSVADMISSGEFLENLDPDTRAKVMAIWEQKVRPAPAAEPEVTPPVDDVPQTSGGAEKHDVITPAPEAPAVEADQLTEDSRVAAPASAAGQAEAVTPAKPAQPRPAKPASGPKTSTRAPAADPMQISLNTTFKMIDAGLYPDDQPRRPAETPSVQPTYSRPATGSTGKRRADVSEPIRPATGNTGGRRAGTSEPIRPAPQVQTTDNTAASETADTDLYLNLGYENELRRTAAGSDKADYVQNLQAAARPVGTRNAVPFAYAGKEFHSRAMTAGIETDYRRSRMLALLRATSAAIGAIILMIYDILPLMEDHALPIGSAYSVRYHVIECILLVLFASPSLYRMLLGLRGLWDFEPVRFSVPALAFSLTLLYDIIAAALARQYGMPVFGGAVLVILTLTASADAVSLLSQMRAFRIVSSGIARYVLTPVNRSASAEHDRNEERGSVTVRACRTRLVSDFFARAEQYNTHLALLNALLPVTLLISLLVGGTGILMSRNPDVVSEPAAVLLSVGLPLFMGSFLAACPGAFVLSLSLPGFIANRKLARHGCAVIGEAAPEQYVPAKPDGSTRLILPDGHALHVTDPREFTDGKDPDADHWSDMAHKLFALTDSGLRRVGAHTNPRDLEGIRVELSSSANGFLDLHMTDQNSGESLKVMAGSYGDLARHGVKMPASDDASAYRSDPSASVMYLSFDHRLRMVCSMKYEAEPMLQTTVDALGREGCRVSLLSYDPSLTRDVLSRIGVGDVDLVRPRLYSSLYAPRSGAVSATGSSFDLCRGWLACKRMHLSYRRSRLLGWLSSVLTGLGIGICALLGVPAALLPALAALWLLLTGAAALILTSATVTGQSLELNEHNPG